MSTSQHHHNQPQHAQPQPLPTPYPQAPLRLPPTYPSQRAYAQAPSLQRDGEHGDSPQYAAFSPVSGPHYAEPYRGTVPMPQSPQDPLPSVCMLNLPAQLPSAPSSHMAMPMTATPVSPPLGGSRFSPGVPFLGMGMQHISVNPYLAHMHPAFLRPKKEIKRRTKTGCMTCRKRRIKCDESRPHCHNCRKSKRECEGYEHVVRPTPAAAPGDPSAQSPRLGPERRPSDPMVTSPLVPPSSPDSIRNPHRVQPATSYGFGPARNSPQISLGTTTASSSAVKYEPFDYPPGDLTARSPIGISNPYFYSTAEPHLVTSRQGQRPPASGYSV